MSKRDRLALLIGVALASGNAVAGDDPAASKAISQEIGLTGSSYKYTEPDIMSLKGAKLGVDYAVTFPVANGWFVKGDIRYANGDVDYESNGTGTSEGNPDWYTEWRLTSGYEFAFGSHTLSPYVGLGYRYLYNDMRGLTSTGHVGYRRESRYVYLPIGLKHAVTFSPRSRLVTTIEYDYLIEGRQKSVLSDTEGYYGWVEVGDVTNKQDRGRGVRLSSMFHTHGWSFGPYASYWKIAQSDVASNVSQHVSLPGWVIIQYWIEPENTTREAGVKVSYTF